MANLDLRERNNAAILYALTAVSIIVWWIILVFYPDSRIHFLGHAFSQVFIWILIVPDLLSAIALAAWLVPSILKNNVIPSHIAWLHAGGQGYAFFISISLALIDPRAYWGAVGMMGASAIAIFLAIRLQDIDVLWGKFKFKPAQSGSPQAHFKRAITQTLVMWMLFLALLPALIAQAEIFFHFDQNWLNFPGQIPLSIALFLILGTVGMWGTIIMTKHGDGTPLPSEHTNKLVILGPYQYIRNPMALCGTLQGAAVGLGIGSPLIMAYAILGAFAWNILVRPAEEAQLLASFGQDFQTYRESVRCWIPRLNRL